MFVLSTHPPPAACTLQCGRGGGGLGRWSAKLDKTAWPTQQPGCIATIPIQCWANVADGGTADGGPTLNHVPVWSYIIIHTSILPAWTPLTGYVCCIFWQIMRAHLLLINLPPRRKTAPPPPFGRHLWRQLGGRQWGDGCMHSTMYTWVHMQCIHTDCYLYTTLARQ